MSLKTEQEGKIYFFKFKLCIDLFLETFLWHVTQFHYHVFFFNCMKVN